MLTLFRRQEQRRELTFQSNLLVSLPPGVRLRPALLSQGCAHPRCLSESQMFPHSLERLIQPRPSLWLRQPNSAGNVKKKNGACHHSWSSPSHLIMTNCNGCCGCPAWAPFTRPAHSPPAVKGHGLVSPSLEIRCLIQEVARPHPQPQPLLTQGYKGWPPCFNVG